LISCFHRQGQTVRSSDERPIVRASNEIPPTVLPIKGNLSSQFPIKEETKNIESNIRVQQNEKGELRVQSYNTKIFFYNMT
jgi:hypothetical protein